MHSLLGARAKRLILAVFAVASLSVLQPVQAQTFRYIGTLDTCGGLCIALGGLFGITTGSPLEGQYEKGSGRFCGQVGTGGSSGILNWDTSIASGGPDTMCPGISFNPTGLIDFGWLLNPASAGLTDDGTNITGGFLTIDNFMDAAALASLLVYVSGSGPQTFGIPGGQTANWVAYLPDAMGNPDPASVVASGSGAWQPSGPAPEPDITVSPNPPATVEIGNVPVGGTPGMGVVTITNDGNADLDLQSLTLTGMNTDFTIDSMAGASPCAIGALAPAASCTVTIEFAPTVDGAATQTLSIGSDDPDENPVTLIINGTGTVGMISLSATMLDFMQVEVGMSTTQNITVTNTGAAPLTIANVGSAGAVLMNPPFSITNEMDCTGAPLPAMGGNCTVTVQFAPVSVGTVASAFDIISNDPNMMSVTVNVMGEGTPPPAPVISVTPTMLSFPATIINQSAMAMDITVENVGNADLTVTVPVGPALPFSITNNGCTAAVMPMGTCVISVDFTPGAVMSFMETFDINSNDAVNSPTTITLNGSGVATPVPAIQVTPTALIFPTILDTQMSVRTVTISNAGNADLLIGQIGGSDPVSAPFSVVTDNCSNQTVAMGSNCTVDFRFTPGMVGSFMDGYDIPSNDPGGAVLASLEGAAVSTPTGFLTVAPTGSIDFGDVIVNQSGTPQTVTLTNNGTADLTFTSITRGGPDAAEFSDTSACGAMLAVTASCTVDIGFTPASAGAKAATLDIVSDASNSPNSIVLAGNGVVGPQAMLSVATLEFGSTSMPIELGQTDNQTVTVTSVGSADLVVSAAALSGTGAAEFSVDASACTAAAVAPMATCDIDLTFAPATAGDKTATLTVTSDDVDMPMMTVDLTGFVLMGSRIDATPAPLEFGSAAVGIELGATDTVTVTVSSTGTDDLNVSALNLTGTGAGDFTTAGDCLSGPVARGMSCSVDVTFAPTTAGDKMASLEIVSDAVGAASTNIGLTGFVFAGSRPEVTVVTFEIGSTMTPVELGQSETASFMINSTGTDDLNITGLALSGADAADFAVAGNCLAAAIPRGGNCTVDVTFTPSSGGNKIATLTITSDSMAAPTITVDVTGIVFMGSRIEVMVTNIDFGAAAPVEVGQDEMQSFQVNNTGTDDLNVTALNITGADAGNFSMGGDCIGNPVARGASCTVEITFAPGSAGAKAALLDLISDAVNGSFSVTLNGTAVAAPPPPPAAPVSQPPANALEDLSTSGHCFIATAAYGSYLDDNVQVLRDFRDNVLLRSDLGRAFVEFYYANSPQVASYIGQRDGLRTAVRWTLTPVVYAVQYPVLALLLLGAMWFGIRRRRDGRCGDIALST